MRIAWVLVTVLVAVVLQVTLARFTVGGRWVTSATARQTPDDEHDAEGRTANARVMLVRRLHARYLSNSSTISRERSHARIRAIRYPPPGSRLRENE